MKRYKVTLTPIGSFFFGGEQTFDNGVRQSYFARSEHMPQQTTLLGMVRYQLLKQEQLLLNPQKEVDVNLVETLIGKESFIFSSSSEQNFGNIINISPVRVQHKGQILFPMSLANGMSSSVNCNVRTYCGNIERTMMIESGSFDKKTYSNYCRFIGCDGDSFSYDDLFLSYVQVGIIKNKNDGEEQAFFKKEVLRFKDKDDAFVFFLTLADDVELKADKVFMGAERSCFDMQVCPDDKEPDYPCEPRPGTILLTSPTYVPDLKKLGECCFFCWSGSLGMRNLEQKEDGKLISGVVRYSRSPKLYTMLSAGSVLFYCAERLDDLKGLLDNQNLQKIGYNKYIVK